MAGLAAELELLFLPLVVAPLQTGGGLLAGLDLLGQLDLLLGGEQVVFADGGEILADQVGGQTTTLVGQLAALTLTLPISPRLEAQRQDATCRLMPSAVPPKGGERRDGTASSPDSSTL